MGNIFTRTPTETYQDRIEKIENTMQITEEGRRYWKSHERRIKNREYYKKNPDEWYLEYMF